MRKIVRRTLSKVEQPVPSSNTAPKVCFELGLKFVMFTEQRNNFVAHWVNDSNAERKFDEKSIETLLSIGLEPKLPWSLELGRTVIIRKLNDDILNSSYGETADELQEQNHWMHLYELWKKFHMLKITLRTINMALRCIDCVISLSYIHITKFKIVREVKINVNIWD